MEKLKKNKFYYIMEKKYSGEYKRSQKKRNTNRKVLRSYRKRGGGKSSNSSDKRKKNRKLKFPMKRYKKGRKFYKGSLSFPCQGVLDYHQKKNEQENGGGCADGTSIYLGPNRKRSLEYFNPEKNVWNVFELKKDLEVIYIDPKRFKEKHMREIVKRALKKNPGFESYLDSIRHFGSLSDLCRTRRRVPVLRTMFESKLICNPDFIERLTHIFCIIFGIERSVYEQKIFLQELVQLGGGLTMDKGLTGWTATPELVRRKNTSLFDYARYYLEAFEDFTDEDYSLSGQRLSYYGFDMVFLTTVCAAGFPGYYYPDIESVHEDAGEELAIFRTNEFLQCRPDLADPEQSILNEKSSLFSQGSSSFY